MPLLGVPPFGIVRRRSDQCIVGEDWIVRRIPSGELKIALYINSYHRSLPDSAPMDLMSAPIGMSVMGPKRTWVRGSRMSALPSEAEIPRHA